MSEAKRSPVTNSNEIEIKPGFNFGLCGCLRHRTSSVEIFCCPSCHIARQCKAIKGQPLTHSHFFCLLAFPTCTWSPLCIRLMMVDKYEMDEWFITSCLKGLCCPYCSLCQTYRELILRGAPSGTACMDPEDRETVWYQEHPITAEMS